MQPCRLEDHIHDTVHTDTVVKSCQNILGSHTYVVSDSNGSSNKGSGSYVTNSQTAFGPLISSILFTQL